MSVLNPKAQLNHPEEKVDGLSQQSVLYVLRNDANNIWPEEYSSAVIDSAVSQTNTTVIEFDLYNYTNRATMSAALTHLWTHTEAGQPISVLFLCDGSQLHTVSQHRRNLVNLMVNLRDGDRMAIGTLFGAIKDATENPVHIIIDSPDSRHIGEGDVSILPRGSIVVASLAPGQLDGWLIKYKKYGTHFPQWSWIEVMYLLYNRFIRTIYYPYERLVTNDTAQYRAKYLATARHARRVILWVDGKHMQDVADDTDWLKVFKRCLKPQHLKTALAYTGIPYLVSEDDIQEATDKLDDFLERQRRYSLQESHFSPTLKLAHTVHTVELCVGQIRTALDAAMKRQSQKKLA
jgi:hypothetical protein